MTQQDYVGPFYMLSTNFLCQKPDHNGAYPLPILTCEVRNNCLAPRKHYGLSFLGITCIPFFGLLLQQPTSPHSPQQKHIKTVSTRSIFPCKPAQKNSLHAWRKIHFMSSIKSQKH